MNTTSSASPSARGRAVVCLWKMCPTHSVRIFTEGNDADPPDIFFYCCQSASLQSKSGIAAVSVAAWAIVDSKQSVEAGQNTKTTPVTDAPKRVVSWRQRTKDTAFGRVARFSIDSYRRWGQSPISADGQDFTDYEDKEGEQIRLNKTDLVTFRWNFAWRF